MEDRFPPFVILLCVQDGGRDFLQAFAFEEGHLVVGHPTVDVVVQIGIDENQACWSWKIVLKGFEED